MIRTIRVKVNNFIRRVIFPAVLLTSACAFSQDLIVNPESIVFDKIEKRYLVTCNGNGKIIEIDSLGNKTVFKTGFSNLLGSHLQDSILYVSSNAGIQGFNIYSGDEKFNVNIPGKGQIDGIAADASGFLYVIDATKRRIYKINSVDKSYSTFVSIGLPQWPQDCVFDEENNRLLVVAWQAAAPIQAVSLTDGSVSTVITTSFGYFDGIARDQYGNIYVSSHNYGGRIYRYDKNFKKAPELISSGHNEPAGLCYNIEDNILAVPNYGGSTINFISMASTAVRDVMAKQPETFKLLQNFPNPFNPRTAISYKLAAPTSVRLEIFDTLGEKVVNLIDEKQPAGVYKVFWDAAGFAGGVYLCRLSTQQGYSQVRKLVLIK